MNYSAQLLHFMFKKDEFKLKSLQRWAIQLVFETESLAYENKMEDYDPVPPEYVDWYDGL